MKSVSHLRRIWDAGLVDESPPACLTEHTPSVTEDMVSGSVYLNGKTGLTSYAFEHNLTDNGFSAPGVITEAKITVIFDEDYTDPSGIDHKEFVKVVVGATTYGSWEIDHNDDFVLTLLPDALTTLSNTGKIGIQAGMTNKGDLRFMESKLVAKGISEDRPLPPQATPEPSTLILLGSGLAGVVTIGLRRRQQENRA